MVSSISRSQGISFQKCREEAMRRRLQPHCQARAVTSGARNEQSILIAAGGQPIRVPPHQTGQRSPPQSRSSPLTAPTYV